MNKDVTRLFRQFQPTHYQLDLVPDRDAMTFRGTVTIQGRKVGRPSQRLTFHQKGLKITKATVIKKDKKGEQPIDITRINLQKSYDEVRLHAHTMVYPGEYTVTLEFHGQITRPMSGIYPSFFTHNDKEFQLLATQFESHHAREAFPCIDEPEAKATFQLTITTPAEEAVVSNTPVEREEKTKHGKQTTFQTTPKMSTYLLAFAYGDMGYKEAQTKDGVQIRVYATPDNVPFTQFALETAVRVLEFYNDYFGIPYPLPKLDMIALPDFAAGAMENWGCVTYREQAVLVDPKNTSLPVKQYVAMVVAHELAHQWFGNLVTMRWWTDLWLNEGFASWIEFLAVDHLYPEWQMWTQFAVDEQQRALKLDALQHTHPVEVPVHHPDEIRTIFDTISYSKGASVIHMLQHYLGADAFQGGLRHYLQQHAYGNTDTVDLWKALEEISSNPVQEFMHAWTSQPGYPLLSVVSEDGSLHLSQSRFYVNPKTPASKAIWPIPLLSGSDLVPETLDKASDSYTIGDVPHLKLNQSQSGFYRTTYNATHLEHLGEAVKKGRLEPLDRLGILADVFEAAKAGKTPTVDALHFLEAYAAEDNNAVWDIIAGSLLSTRNVMHDEDLRDAMKPYIRKLVAAQLKRLGWQPLPKESHFDSLLRPTILGLASGAEEPSVVKESLRLFDNMSKPEDVAPDVRGIVYATAVRERNDTATFEKLLKMHNASASSEERVNLASALTNFKDSKLMSRALKLIDTEAVRLQDVAYWIAYGYGNRFGRQATWEWMKDHWEWLAKNLGDDLSFHRFPVYAANAFASTDFLKEYQAFFEPRRDPSTARAIDQGTEIITWQSAWRDRDLESIKAFFSNTASSTAS